MAGLDDFYARKIHKDLDLFVDWMPGDHNFQLGDYGEMDGKIFKKKGNITQKFGIRIKPKEQQRKSTKYQSSSGIEIKVDAGAKGKGKQKNTKGNVIVHFKKDKLILFKAQKITIQTIDRLDTVGEKLVDLYKKRGKDWRLSYVVITEVQKARHMLALISKKGNHNVKLSGTLPVKKNGVTVADLDIRDLRVSANSAQVLQFEDHNGSTPLFQLHEVKDPITKKAYFTEYK